MNEWMNEWPSPWGKKQRSQGHPFISRAGTRTCLLRASQHPPLCSVMRLGASAAHGIGDLLDICECHPKPSCCLYFCSDYLAGFWFFVWLPIRPRAVGKEKANNRVAWWKAVRSLARASQFPAGAWVSRYTKAYLFGRIFLILCVQNAFSFF